MQLNLVKIFDDFSFINGSKFRSTDKKLLTKMNIFKVYVSTDQS